MRVLTEAHRGKKVLLNGGGIVSHRPRTAAVKPSLRHRSRYGGTDVNSVLELGPDNAPSPADEGAGTWAASLSRKSSPAPGVQDPHYQFRLYGRRFEPKPSPTYNQIFRGAATCLLAKLSHFASGS